MTWIRSQDPHKHWRRDPNLQCFLIGCFLYLHFKCYLLSLIHHPENSPVSPSFPWLYEGVPTPTSLPSISLYWGTEPSPGPRASLLLMSNKSILYHKCIQSHRSLQVSSLVCGPVPGSWGGGGEETVSWPVDTVAPSMGLQTPLSSLSTFSKSLIWDSELSPKAESIPLCILRLWQSLSGNSYTRHLLASISRHQQ